MLYKELAKTIYFSRPHEHASQFKITITERMILNIGTRWSTTINIRISGEWRDYKRVTELPTEKSAKQLAECIINAHGLKREADKQ